MFVRMKIGRYAGEIREVKFADGQQLLTLGHAEKADTSSPPEPSADLSAAAVPPPGVPPEAWARMQAANKKANKRGRPGTR